MSKSLLAIPIAPVVTKANRREAERAARHDAAAWRDEALDPKAIAARATAKSGTFSFFGLPYQQELQNDCDMRLRDDLARRFAAVRLSPDLVGAGDVAKAEERAEQARTRALHARKARDEFDYPHWPGRMPASSALWVLLGLGLFEVVLIVAALELLRMSDLLRFTIAAFFGVIPIITIEISSGDIVDLLRWHRDAEDARRRWLFGAGLQILHGGALVGFIVFMGFIRVDGFTANRGHFAGVPHDYSVELAIAMSFLQAVATAAAVSFSRQRAMSGEWRARDAEARAAERIALTLQDEALSLADEPSSFRDLVRASVDEARNRHEAIIDYFGACEAAYRTVLRHQLPEVENVFGNVWTNWRALLLEDLKDDYTKLREYYGSLAEPVAPGQTAAPPPGGTDSGPHSSSIDLTEEAVKADGEESPEPNDTNTPVEGAGQDDYPDDGIGP